MTEETKKRIQTEWAKTVVLTPEQFSKLIKEKAARNKSYSMHVKKPAVRDCA